MTNEFVPYELALALKGLGFDEPCFSYFKNRELSEILEEVRNTEMANVNNEVDDYISAPLYQQAFRWFREKYRLHSHVYPDLSWNISGGVWDLDGYADSRYDWDSGFFKTFEEAELDCIIKLIEIVKVNTA
jgi:hypothetical protein